MKFSELNLNPAILKALDDMGYKELTPIQEKTFPHILKGRDLLATAETGSGKTSACGIPLIQRIDPKLDAIQALILVPTRELAHQYVDEISRIARYLQVIPFAIYGGFDIDVQKAKLQDLVHVLIATPGRLIDLLYGGHISLSQVKTLVLDEADEMLDLGFLEDIDLIFSCLLHEHETMLFSATMPREIKRLAENYLHEPVVIELSLERRAPEALEHSFLYSKSGGRLEAMLDYLKGESVRQAIIFCNSRSSAERLEQAIRGRLSSSEIIHGGFEQSRRNSIISRFRAGKIRFLIATNLAGRGLDFTRVSHIINYDFPQSNEIYTHRTGRTARMGRTGMALTLVTGRDLHHVKRLLRATEIEPKWVGPAPDLDRNRYSGPGRHSRREKSVWTPHRGRHKQRKSSRQAP